MYCSNLMHFKYQWQRSASSSNGGENKIHKKSLNTPPTHLNNHQFLHLQKNLQFLLGSVLRAICYHFPEVPILGVWNRHLNPKRKGLSSSQLLNFRGGNSYTPPLLKLPNKGHQRGNVHPMVDMTSVIYTTNLPSINSHKPQKPKH